METFRKKFELCLSLLVVSVSAIARNQGYNNFKVAVYARAYEVRQTASVNCV